MVQASSHFTDTQTTPPPEPKVTIRGHVFTRGDEVIAKVGFTFEQRQKFEWVQGEIQPHINGLVQIIDSNGNKIDVPESCVLTPNNKQPRSHEIKTCADSSLLKYRARLTLSALLTY